MPFHDLQTDLETQLNENSYEQRISFLSFEAYVIIRRCVIQDHLLGLVTNQYKSDEKERKMEKSKEKNLLSKQSTNLVYFSFTLIS